MLPHGCFTLVANQPLYDYRSFAVPHHDTFDNRLLESYRPAFWFTIMILFVYEELKGCRCPDSGTRTWQMRKHHPNHSAGFCSDWQRLPPRSLPPPSTVLIYRIKLNRSYSTSTRYRKPSTCPSFCCYLYPNHFTALPNHFCLHRHRIQINQSIDQSRASKVDSLGFAVSFLFLTIGIR